MKSIKSYILVFALIFCFSCDDLGKKIVEANPAVPVEIIKLRFVNPFKYPTKYITQKKDLQLTSPGRASIYIKRIKTQN